MYIDVTGYNVYRAYFILFYYFGVIIGINIMIAFAIDMFSAVERMDSDYERNKQILLKKALEKRDEYLNANIEESNNIQAPQRETFKRKTYTRESWITLRGK